MIAVLATAEQAVKGARAAPHNGAIAAILAAALADAIAFREDAAASRPSGPESGPAALRARQEHRDQADRYCTPDGRLCSQLARPRVIL